MTSRSPISSSLFAAALALSALAITAPAATVSGNIVLHDSHIDSVTRGKDFSGVVISLLAVNQPPPPPPILPVVAGSTIDFPNADPIFHNAFSSYSGQIFDVGLYPPHTSRSVKFQKPGIVRVFCNIHPSMSAIILVLNTPTFTVTPTSGEFHLDVPPGTYDLRVFHERSTEQSLDALQRRIVVPATGLRLPPIAVSEAGYLMAPHKNKYGKDYDPAPDDRTFYPGARQ